MSASNYVRGVVECPRCGTSAAIAAECKLGRCESADLHVGDEYPFEPHDWPPARVYDAEAFSGCGSCKLDFTVRVRIEQGIIRALTPEPRAIGWHPDAVLTADVTCPECGEPATREIQLFCGSTRLELRPGDRYEAGARRIDARGSIRGRAVCPTRGCQDFVVRVFLRDDVIRSVAVDPDQSWHAPGLVVPA